MFEPALLAALTEAIGRAAAVVLAASRLPFKVREKADRSPVTEADEHAQTVLLEALARLMPGIAVVSEEMPASPSQLGDVFALVDPLDGTREFIAGSSEYTVNLGLVRDGVPVAGIIAVPAHGLIYRGVVGRGAERLAMAADGAVAADALPRSVKVRTATPAGLIAAVSRSHLDPTTVALLDRLGVAARIPCGSALKFCRVAEGAADLYPRLATTCEWDVAAGHALIAAAGGSVALPDGEDLRYGVGDQNFRIPAFIAWGDRTGAVERG